MASIATHSWGASDPNQKGDDGEQLRKEVLENSKEMPQQRSEKFLLKPSNTQYKSAQDLGNTSGAVSPNPSEKAPVTSENTMDNMKKTANMASVTNLHPPNSSDPCIIPLPNQNSILPFPMAPTANHSPQDKSNLLQNPLKDQHLTKFENSSPPPQLSYIPIQNIQTYPHLPEQSLCQWKKGISQVPSQTRQIIQSVLQMEQWKEAGSYLVEEFYNKAAKYVEEEMHLNKITRSNFTLQIFFYSPSKKDGLNRSCFEQINLVLFSKRTDHGMGESICEILQMKKVDRFNKYHEVPLIWGNGKLKGLTIASDMNIYELQVEVDLKIVLDFYEKRVPNRDYCLEDM
ncbi:hypothetical protein RJT34_32150 [Clitoria ternatea]|uniref:Uncharacterized protein n=1 Tax=Clitoria ternatea TaxID=43366 RepID=A0AAN9EXS0_CLITE